MSTICLLAKIVTMLIMQKRVRADALFLVLRHILPMSAGIAKYAKYARDYRLAGQSDETAQGFVPYAIAIVITAQIWGCDSITF